MYVVCDCCVCVFRVSGLIAESNHVCMICKYYLSKPVKTKNYENKYIRILSVNLVIIIQALLRLKLDGVVCYIRLCVLFLLSNSKEGKAVSKTAKKNHRDKT